MVTASRAAFSGEQLEFFHPSQRQPGVDRQIR